MSRWPSPSPTIGKHLITALGGVYVLLALVHVVLSLRAGQPLVDVLIDVVLIGGPGVALLYGEVKLSRSRLVPAVYLRVAGWCLGGGVLLLVIVGLLVVNPAEQIDDPLWAAVLASALGSTGGFAIGLNEAQALTRAREAEQREQELETHRRQLQQQNDQLESFAGMLAHELRNPVTIAQIYHSQERPRNEAAAEHVQNAIDRIEGMIDILLVTVRGADVTIDYESVDVAALAEEAWRDLEVDAETAELVVVAEQTIRADPVHVEHLLRNLFRNSLEHGDDEMTVRVGDLPDVSASQASGGSTDESVGGFYVEDDGPGIPEDRREDVSQAGFTTKGDGIGLGLTFVGQLADTYGWEWSVTDSPEGGARFEFTGVERVSPSDELTRQ